MELPGLGPRCDRVSSGLLTTLSDLFAGHCSLVSASQPACTQGALNLLKQRNGHLLVALQAVEMFLKPAGAQLNNLRTRETSWALDGRGCRPIASSCKQLIQ